MFSSGAGSSSFKGLRRKAATDGRSSTLHVARPSTAASTDRYYSDSITDLLEPAMDGPPSPEGIRAFSRRIKRGSIVEQQNNEQTTSSGSSSIRSETPETGEHSLENPSMSRNPSQRVPAVPFRERPDSVQLFGKAVFGRRPKLRREQSDQGYSTTSLLSVNEVPMNGATDPSKEQRFIHSMFARRTRGTSEASQKKFQISGPYDFQHVSHSSKANLPKFDASDRNEPLSNVSGARPRTTTGASATGGFYPVDKPLPTPPSPPQEFERSLSRDSIQLPPPRPPIYISDDVQTPPIPPLPQTSGRASAHRDRTDSFSTTPIDKTDTNSSHQAQPFRFSSRDGLWPPPTAHVSNAQSEPYATIKEEISSHSIPSTDEASWPLTGSMSSLPEVPEEEECHQNNSTSCKDFVSNPTSLRGSMSVPHLRSMSFSKAARRSPSNASETLGRFDVTAAQRALYELDNQKSIEDDFSRHSWEDDIDYCYDHAAEADCDFAWERPSCDLEREDYYPESPIISPIVEFTSNRLGLAPPRHSSTDLPGLSPTSNDSSSTQHGVPTPTSATMLTPSNFSLPKLDTSLPLKRDHDRSQSSASSFQEAQEFCLSPSLLIPNDYHERVLHYERGDLNVELNDGPYLKFDKSEPFANSRSSASTTLSTLSEHSVASSRYPSSGFTRWTGSSTSSWQVHVEPQQPVAITLNDKDHVLTPTSDMTVVSPSETSVASLKQDASRDGHSRAQSDANLLMKMNAIHDTDTTPESKAATESAHRRTRTASRIQTNPPQFTLFPQGTQRF
ncbi:hypothetical protein F4861DRAFT_258921 [Xylaria intraflava]|nr:hypothetical protein F4861DRAFT_258921 [Xylaria intraflava]